MTAPRGPAAEESSPVYTRWWFWTIVAAAAVGAGVGIAAATGVFDRDQDCPSGRVPAERPRSSDATSRHLAALVVGLSALGLGGACTGDGLILVSLTSNEPVDHAIVIVTGADGQFAGDGHGRLARRHRRLKLGIYLFQKASRERST